MKPYTFLVFLTLVGALHAQCENLHPMCVGLQCKCKELHSTCKDLNCDCKDRNCDCKDRNCDCKDLNCDCKDLNCDCKDRNCDCKDLNCECEDLNCDCEDQNCDCKDFHPNGKDPHSFLEELKAHGKDLQPSCEDLLSHCKTLYPVCFALQPCCNAVPVSIDSTIIPLVSQEEKIEVPLSTGQFSARQEGHAISKASSSSGTKKGLTISRLQGMLANSGKLRGANDAQYAYGGMSRSTYAGDMKGNGALWSKSKSLAGPTSRYAVAALKGLLNGKGSTLGRIGAGVYPY